MAAGDDLLVFPGRIRVPGDDGAAGTVTLDETTVILEATGVPSRTLGYRDLAILALSGGAGLVATGPGQSDERWILEGFGAACGPLIAALRERRLRQRLQDGFVVLPESEPVELVEYAFGDHGAGACCTPSQPGGIAQLAVDGWGATLAPLDERQPTRRYRRAEIQAVEVEPEVGGVQVQTAGGGFHLLRLGAAAARHRDRLAALPAAAHRDAGAIVAALVPDLAPGAAGRAAAALVDGRPASPGELGEAWEAIERGVLTEPTFAASYLALRERAGGDNALRWLALAPERPGAPEEDKAWFLVALPGNLVALELVSEGAHATYCFRTVSRVAYGGGTELAGIDAAAARRAVGLISNALVDARFLREPIALPDDQLATPKGTRYRLALRALPALAAARGAFVARLVHRDGESWAAALDDLVAWHGACRDDTATWPGRQAQEALVADAAGGSGG